MKWNAKPLAGFGLLLTACAGAAHAQSVGAQAWSQPAEPAYAQPQQRGPAPLPQQQDQASETWRAADGTIRTRQRAPAVQPQTYPPQQQQSYPAPQAQPQAAPRRRHAGWLTWSHR